ncbi:MAG TPA: hypothetical protein PK560_02480 [bacterium]|nr:hypothetical protein [bacterium]
MKINFVWLFLVSFLLISCELETFVPKENDRNDLFNDADMIDNDTAEKDENDDVNLISDEDIGDSENLNDNEYVPVCGNGIVEGWEICDLNQIACSELNGKLYAGGLANCNPDCRSWDMFECALSEDYCIGDFNIIFSTNIISKCRHIKGNLIITSSILKSIYLPELESVEGNLEIWDNNFLESVSFPSLKTVSEKFLLGDIQWDFLTPTFDGSIGNKVLSEVELPELISVGKTFRIVDGRLVKSFSLPKLKSSGFFQLAYNTDLEEIFLPLLESSEDGFSVIYNNSLKSLNAENINNTKYILIKNNNFLESINFSDITKVDDLSVADNGSMQSISFPLLEEIAEDFLIKNNPLVEPFSFPELKKIGGKLNINDNYSIEIFFLPLLESVTDMAVYTETIKTINLPLLKTICNDIQITNNSSLEMVKLPKLETIGGFFRLEKNTSPAMINMELLNEIGGNLSITENTLIESLNLPELKTVKGTLEIRTNQLISSVYLDKLSQLDGGFTLINNQLLEILSLSALENSGGHFRIMDNENLKFISTDNIVSIGEDLELNKNQSLESVDMLSLKTVGQSFRINNHTVLEKVTLPFLESVTGKFMIFNNSLLKEFNFQSLSRIEDYFRIENNPELSSLLAEELKDQVISGEGIGGEVIISGNKE